MTRSAARLRDERGMALLLAIVLVMMLAAVGSAAVLAGQAETLISANFRQGYEARYVAEGAVARVVPDLASLPDWTLALSGAATSSFAEGSAMGLPPPPAGGAAALYGWGPASAWLPGASVSSAFYAAVWISDDEGDGDGRADADSNGIVAVTAAAIGPGGARRWVETLVQRIPAADGHPARVRILSSVESRW